MSVRPRAWRHHRTCDPAASLPPQLGQSPQAQNCGGGLGSSLHPGDPAQRALGHPQWTEGRLSVHHQEAFLSGRLSCWSTEQEHRAGGSTRRDHPAQRRAGRC